jgi:hypothetical protein
MDVPTWNLVVGWSSMAAGVMSGAWIGLSFAQDGWLGGYSSFPRRMLRLGHIACFGIGILNVLFALTVQAMPLPPTLRLVGSIGFTAAALTMAPCCFLTAWRAQFQRLFPIPVLSAFTGVLALVGGLLA